MLGKVIAVESEKKKFFEIGRIDVGELSADGIFHNFSGHIIHRKSHLKALGSSFFLHQLQDFPFSFWIRVFHDGILLDVLYIKPFLVFKKISDIPQLKIREALFCPEKFG